MTTLAAPAQKPRLSSRWIIAGVVVIVVAIGIALAVTGTSAQPAAAGLTTAPVTVGALTATVDGSGTVAAEQSLDLPFQTSGTVIEVLVAEGDVVAVGQPLARLDTRELELQVASAESSLESARARMAQLTEGNATPEQVAASQASIASAEANLVKARTGNITAADIAEAEAQLRSAQAKLDDLKAGPKADALTSAEVKVAKAETNLQSQRDSLSAAKTRAQSQLEQAAITLRERQADYEKIYWDNRELEALPGDLPDDRVELERQALADVRSAEESLRQAQVAFDQAVQAEITGIAGAEADLRDAQEQLRNVRAGADTVDIVQAQASVDQARANLQKLRQGGTAADVAAAQASVDQARANLAQLTASATASDLQIQQASIAQAESSLAQARLNLEQATLTAPFAGIISQVDIVPGSIVSATAPVITLIDRDPLHIDLRLSENDVAKVELGQPVGLTIDALQGWRADGTVSYIAPSAETSNDVVTYRVRVTFADAGAQVKVGMTANLSIITAVREGALLVPNTALLPKGASRIVQMPNADGTVREVEVQTGLSDGVQTEILSGLSAGDAIVIRPSAPREQGSGLPLLP